MTLQQTFNKFCGLEVKIEETPHNYGGQSHVSLQIAQDEPVIAEIRDLAAEQGYKLRPRLPGGILGSDFKTDRLNVSIAKEVDGKYRIQRNSFHLG